MELSVLDPNLEQIGILDTFESLIWTDRYFGAGDFEITASPNNQFLSSVNQGLYLCLKESEHTMIIDYLNLHSDAESGKKGTIKGRSLESILDRRIVWYPTVLSDSAPNGFQNGIKTLLDQNAINPSDPDRKILRLEFEMSTDPIITALTIDSQFWGENLYTVIVDLCLSRNIGFKITLTDQSKFLFKLYAGADRSYDQVINPYVVFSPNFENLLNADYTATNQRVKTVTLVAGELGVGNGRRTIVVPPTGAGVDLARREMYTDAQSVSRNVPGEEPLNDEEYLSQLLQKGMEDLANNTFIQTFDGQADTSLMYAYGKDFFMGDIMQVENEYGHQGKSRVIELIHSQDPSGIKTYPTFNTV